MDVYTHLVANLLTTDELEKLTGRLRKLKPR
jgi:hypothetical protein